MAAAIGAGVAVAVMAIASLAVCVPIFMNLAKPRPAAPARQFIDISKVDKVYTVLVPD